MRNYPLITDNRIVQWELVKPGLGIGVMQESGGDAARTVTRALPNLDRVPGEMSLVAHSGLRTGQRIRSVFDFWPPSWISDGGLETVRFAAGTLRQ